MSLSFSVSGRISKPLAQVFEAVVAPEQLSSYFTTGGAQGRLESGAIVTWDFHDFPGAFPVQVKEVMPQQRVVLSWQARDDSLEGESLPPHDTTVTFTFEVVAPNRTLVMINEAGWRDTPKGRHAAFANCEGWTGMLAAMKVWLEHGIKLREGFYK